MQINHNNKLISIWLKTNELCDRSILNKILQDKPKDYLLAVYYSGTENLIELTTDLLCRNLIS